MPVKRNGPVFEIGVARSGTTILSLMLDAHPRLAIPYESHFFIEYYRNWSAINERMRSYEGRRQVVAEILDEPYVRGWDHTPPLDSIDLAGCTGLDSAIRAVYESYASYHGKDIWGDKTPRYITHIDVLNNLFPDGKFIHLVRDGRDVALSLMAQRFGPSDFVSALRFWREKILVGQKMLAMLPEGRVFTLRMEDLAAAPEEHMGELCDFLDIGYDPQMLTSFRENLGDKVGARIEGHHAGLSKPLEIGNVTKWDKKLSAADQAVAWEYAGDLLREFGYPAGVKKHWAKSFRKMHHRIVESIRWQVGRRLLE